MVSDCTGTLFENDTGFARTNSNSLWVHWLEQAMYITPIRSREKALLGHNGCRLTEIKNLIKLIVLVSKHIPKCVMICKTADHHYNIVKCQTRILTVFLLFIIVLDNGGWSLSYNQYQSVL